MLVAMTNGYNQVASVDIISDALLMLAINRRLLQLKMDQQTLLLLKRIVIMCFFLVNQAHAIPMMQFFNLAVANKFVYNNVLIHFLELVSQYSVLSS